MSQADFVSRGQALVAAGQFQEAVKVCRLGLLGRPTTVEGRVVLGQALLALKRYDEVLAEMRVALELDHTSVSAQVLRADALLRKGDTDAAIEALHKARQAAPGDPRILQMLGEAEHGQRPSTSTSHPAVGFVGSGDTKHYPNHPAGDEESTEGFTRPTSLQAPGSIRRSSQRSAAVLPDPTPSPDVLAVGDRSGTVEVDPEAEGIELEGELDFDDLAAPPPAGRPGKIGGARGSVKSSRGPAETAHGKRGTPKPGSKKTPTLDLELDDDDLDLGDTQLPQPRKRAPGPGTAVRNAVAMPSGPIDIDGPPRRSKPTSVPPPPRSKGMSAVPPLAQAIASVPHVMELGTVPPTPAPLPPAPGAPRNSLAAALPTVAAMQPPIPGYPAQPGYPQQVANAARPTMAIGAPQPLSMAQQQSAAAVDALFGNEGPAPAWARSTVAAQQAVDPRSVAAANEPTARPDGMDPAIIAMMQGGAGNPAVAMEHVSVTPGRGEGMRTGVRRARSRMQIAMWFLIGIVVIGGGVFAGFQIRAMRLKKQIAAARDHATELAKADTWAGWTAARDSLAGIVQAQNTTGNIAALAKARALIAYEFGDGVADAKTAVDQLAGGGGLDGELAAAYLALAQNDPKAAKLAADAALATSSQDAAALYVAGQAALLAGDPKTAATYGKAASDREGRPLYGIGLARAHAAGFAWDEAIAAIDRVLSGNPEHTAALIARGNVLAASGRIAPGSPLAAEVRTQLQKVISEGKRPLTEQTHGVSPAQLAFAYLALAQVDFARGDVTTARTDLNNATSVNLEDQRFAEEALATLYMLGDLPVARALVVKALEMWPTSRRARIALAEIALALGKAQDALDALAKQPEVMALPLAQAVRGQARIAAGDYDGARGDFEAALRKLPNLEPAIVGAAWLDLSAGAIDDALKRVEPRFSANGSSAAITTVYAAALRASADPATREKAKGLLEKVVQGPPGVDVARAQLELARLYRDMGDFRLARPAYVEAAKTGNFEARLEGALLAIEDREPKVGREALDQMLTEAGDRPPPAVVVEAARARMLMGDHIGAAQLIDQAEKLSVPKWKVDRERGRLALRKSDFPGAAAALSRALEASGDDLETFLLAADVATADEKSLLGEKVKQLAPVRLKGKPELQIVNGKLLLATGKDAEAVAAYSAAKEALKKDNASSRRLAQADFGIAVTAYNRQNDAEAGTDLELVISEDPSIYDAYLFAADIAKDKKKAFELADKARTLNPDYPRAWVAYGKLAHKLGDKKGLADAIGKLQQIAPQGDELKELQALKK